MKKIILYTVLLFLFSCGVTKTESTEGIKISEEDQKTPREIKETDKVLDIICNISKCELMKQGKRCLKDHSCCKK